MLYYSAQGPASISTINSDPRLVFEARSVFKDLRYAARLSPMLLVGNICAQSSPVSIQTQSLALRALRKWKPQETQSLALASSQSWLPLLWPSIPIGCNRQPIGMLGHSSGNHDWLLANASDCVWMETGLQPIVKPACVCIVLSRRCTTFWSGCSHYTRCYGGIVEYQAVGENSRWEICRVAARIRVCIDGEDIVHAQGCPPNWAVACRVKLGQLHNLYQYPVSLSKFPTTNWASLRPFVVGNLDRLTGPDGVLAQVV